MKIISCVNKCFLITLILCAIHPGILAQDYSSEIKALSRSADIILTGKVIQQNSQWNEDKTRIYTKVTIEVEEYIKGNKDRQIVVTHPGGEIGGVGELYTHVPKFNNEEEVLVFLREDSFGHGFSVLNGDSGKMTLFKDKATGERLTPFYQKISAFKNEIKRFLGNQQ